MSSRKRQLRADVPRAWGLETQIRAQAVHRGCPGSVPAPPCDIETLSRTHFTLKANHNLPGVSPSRQQPGRRQDVQEELPRLAFLRCNYPGEGRGEQQGESRH